MLGGEASGDNRIARSCSLASAVGTHSLAVWPCLAQLPSSAADDRFKAVFENQVCRAEYVLSVVATELWGLRVYAKYQSPFNLTAMGMLAISVVFLKIMLRCDVCSERCDCQGDLLISYMC